jgi:hypothetical protein
MFEDTKLVIRSCKLEDRQYNVQNKNDKRTSKSREILTNVDYKRNVYLWEKQNIYYYILLNSYTLTVHCLKIIELP